MKKGGMILNTQRNTEGTQLITPRQRGKRGRKADNPIAAAPSQQPIWYKKMSTTVIPSNSMENGFIIMTQVMPAQPDPSGTGQNVPEPGAGFFSRPPTRSTGHDQHQDRPCTARIFLKREPKVLGTVQIMIGLISLLFSIVLIQETYMLFTQSLHGFWGSVIYILAGILSVVAERKFHPQLVKVLLVVNVFSAVAAGTAVVLHSLDIAFTEAYGPFNPLSFNRNCSLFMINGISGVLLVFSLLQFIVSICLLLFGLEVTFCAEPMMCTGSQFPNHLTCCLLNHPFHVHGNEEDVFVISNPNMDNLLLTQPPPYNEIEPQFHQ